jgi:hypothetical protein
VSLLPKKAEVGRFLVEDVGPLLTDHAWLLCDKTGLVEVVGDDLVFGIEFDRRSQSIEVLAWLRPQYWPVPDAFGFVRGIGAWGGLLGSGWEPFSIPQKRKRAAVEISRCLNEGLFPYFAGIDSTEEVLRRLRRWPRDPLLRDPAVGNVRAFVGYLHAWCGHRFRAELNFRAALLTGGLTPDGLADGVRQTLRRLPRPELVRELLVHNSRELRAHMKLDSARPLSAWIGAQAGLVPEGDRGCQRSRGVRRQRPARDSPVSEAEGGSI